MQIFGEIPFIKPQNDNLTTDKRLKIKEKDLPCWGLVFAACSVLGIFCFRFLKWRGEILAI